MSRNRKKQKTKPGFVTVTFWNIPEKIKSDFKSECALAGVTMQDEIVELMKFFVDKRKERRGQKL